MNRIMQTRRSRCSKDFDTGFRLSKEICTLQVKSVEYLGHIIDAEGLHPTEDKIRAICDAPPSQNVTQ